MHVQVPCSCGGSNENCSRCFGSGFIVLETEFSSVNVVPSSLDPDRPPQIQEKGLTERLIGESKSGGGKWPRKRSRSFYCEKCKFYGTRKQYREHQDNIHLRPRLEELAKARKAVALDPNASPTIPDLLSVAPHFENGITVCPLCSAQLRFARLGRHLRDRCPQRWKVSRPTSCKVSVPIKRFNSAPATFTEKRHLTIGASSIPAEIQTIDHMDANRGIGFVVREQGRYGSYSLHDDYGDESGPDAKY